MTSTDIPGDPSTVDCPNCQAKAGSPCTQPTDTSRKAVTWYHDARTGVLIDAKYADQN